MGDIIVSAGGSDKRGGVLSMILRGKLKDDFDNVVSLCKYHPYKVRDESGNMVKNKDADQFTYIILDLKMGNEEQQRAVVERVFSFLDPNVEAGVVVAVVPGHDPDKTDSGIRKAAIRLANTGRIDGTGCLVRHTKVAKKTAGGSRQLDVDLKSIKVVNADLIKGKLVLLLDDVSTSGNSLAACRQLLLDAGASEVQRLTIGRTVH